MQNKTRIWKRFYSLSKPDYKHITIHNKYSQGGMTALNKGKSYSEEGPVGPVERALADVESPELPKTKEYLLRS